MQRHEVPLDAARVERREKLRREMQPGGRRRDGALLAGIDGLVVGAVALVVRPLRGDVGRQRHVADRCPAPRREMRRKGRRQAAPRRPRASPATVASSAPSRQALPSWPKLMRSPGATRLAGRRKASQRSAATRMCSVASICATASPRRRMPLSCAGMTLVSLKTSTSPGSSRAGRSRDEPVLEILARPDHQQPRRIARHRPGRSAIRSSGSSKSKRSTRINRP